MFVTIQVKHLKLLWWLWIMNWKDFLEQIVLMYCPPMILNEVMDTQKFRTNSLSLAEPITLDLSDTKHEHPAVVTRDPVVF